MEVLTQTRAVQFDDSWAAVWVIATGGRCLGVVVTALGSRSVGVTTTWRRWSDGWVQQTFDDGGGRIGIWGRGGICETGKESERCQKWFRFMLCTKWAGKKSDLMREAKSLHLQQMKLDYLKNLERSLLQIWASKCCTFQKSEPT